MPKLKLCTWVCRCRVRYSVRSDDPDLHLLPNRVKCQSILNCRYYLARNDDVRPGQIVRALDFYKTINGLGSVDERRCSPAELMKLIGTRIINFALTPAVDKNRSFISSFTLEGGITVHLAPSTKGVTAYKVTRE